MPGAVPLDILEDQNRWWRDASYRRAGSYRVRRQLQGEVLKRLLRVADRRAVLVRGPRQVGKTVLLLQTADDLLAAGWPAANLLYFDFSDERLVAEVSPRQLAEIRPAGFDPSHPRALLLDEIGLAPRWDRWLKQAIDAGEGARIAATDSAAALLSRGGEESGQGRWDEIVCEGFTLRDFAALYAAPDESVETTLRRDPGLFERYLTVGGFPEHATSFDQLEVRRRLRGDVADRAIRRDLARSGVEVDQVGRLFAYLVESSGAIFSAQERGRDLDADHRSVRKWLDLLAVTLLIWRLERHHERAAPRLRSAPKVFAADPGLVAAFSAAVEPPRGALFEAAVFRHLREVARTVGAGITYFRTPDDLEIDFVLSTRDGVVGIEVTSSGRIRPEKIERLRQAGRRLQADRLLLIHGGAASASAAGVALLGLPQFLADPERSLFREGGG